MKCVILLSLIAFAAAVPLTGPFYGPVVQKNISIDEDGTITITTPTGKKVVISKAIGVDSKHIDISVEGPNIPTKKIQIEGTGSEKTATVDISNPYEFFEDRDKRSPKMTKTTKTGTKLQSDLIGEIFAEYQGAVDEKSFGKLLDKVEGYVASGDLDSNIADALRFLHEKQAMEKAQGMTPEFKQMLDAYIQDSIKRRMALPYNAYGQNYPYYMGGQQYYNTVPQEDEQSYFQQKEQTVGDITPVMQRLQLQATTKQQVPVTSQQFIPLRQTPIARSFVPSFLPTEIQQLRTLQNQEAALMAEIGVNKMLGKDLLVAQQTEQLQQLKDQQLKLQDQLVAKKIVGYNPWAASLNNIYGTPFQPAAYGQLSKPAYNSDSGVQYPYQRMPTTGYY